MSLFIYQAEECRLEAQRFSVTSHVERLTEQLEHYQSLSLLHAFVHPFWMKKRLGNRRIRLICCEEWIEIEGEKHQILLMLKVAQRQDKDYDELAYHMGTQGYTLRDQRIDLCDVRRTIQQRLRDQPIRQRQRPNEAEQGYLYADHPYPNLDSDMVYESWSWCDTIAQQQPINPAIADQLLNLQTEATVIGGLSIPVSGTPSSTLHLRRFNHSKILFLAHFTHSKADSTPIKRTTAIDIQALLDSPDQNTAEFKQQLKRASRRAYPEEMLSDTTLWQQLQADSFGNLPLSDQEAHIIGLAKQTNRPYPLFINGQAGSGKSTVLQYLFADYLLYGLQQQLDPQLALPVYFSCSQPLVERATTAVEQLLRSGSRYAHIAQRTLLIDPQTQRIRHCFHEFRSYLYQQLPQQVHHHFSKTNFVDYGRFKLLWRQRFGQERDAIAHYPPDLCWHVIRSYIKGMSIDELMDSEEYAELDDAHHSVSQRVFDTIYQTVWLDWYDPLCEHNNLWDDQDLARYVLAHQFIRPQFPAIFCDESQDFTRIELHIILHLCLFSDRTLPP
ncbi:MAG: hypothetical protein RLY58_1945, partial [Pseudomonadota bacterium]